MQQAKTRIVFHITDACNMRCKYCYEKHGRRIMPIQYGKDLLDEVFNLLLHQTASFLYGYLDCETWSQIELNFIGGEVTLYMDIVEEICDYFIEKCQEYGLDELLGKYKIIIETNGTTYFNKDVQGFLQKFGEKVELPITTDGCEACFDINRVKADGSSAFKDVDSALKDYIDKYNMIPDSKLTFTPASFKYIKEDCEYLASLGYKKCRMNIDVNYKLNKNETNEYYQGLCRAIDWVIDNKVEFLPDALTKNYFIEGRINGYCGMYGQMIVVDPEGKLFNCHRFSSTSLGDKEMPIGSIITKTIDFDFVNEFLQRKTIHTNPKCVGCPISRACEECPIVNFEHTGSLYESWNSCGEIIALAKAQLYLLQRVKETNYPYFKEDLDNMTNCYDPNFKYLLDYESEETV